MRPFKTFFMIGNFRNHWKAKSSSKLNLQFPTMEFALPSKDPSTCRFPPMTLFFGCSENDTAKQKRCKLYTKKYSFLQKHV